jgi:hypothetical protein
MIDINIFSLDSRECKEVNGFNNYLIYNNGIVFSKNRSKIKNLYELGGRRKVNLFKNGIAKSFYIDYLVATHFIDNHNNYRHIIHKDGNKLNNNYSNLEWSKYGTTHHGMSGTKIYGIWEAMKQRCLNFNDKGYVNYGGRGITVFEDWMSPIPFIEWAINNGYKEGLEIDRINNNGNYEPNNCRFVSTPINGANQRKRKTNSSGYTGVYFYPNKNDKKYWSFITSHGKRISLNYHKTKEDAVIARNNYIVKNNLPHPIQEV